MRHVLLFLLVLALGCTTATPPAPAPQSAYPELDALTPAARAEVLAIARLFAKNPRLAVDFSKVGMHGLSAGFDTMVTFAADPAKTTEDIIFFVPARGLIRAGLDTSKFSPVPAVGAMEPGRWYYSSGRDPEPRFNNNAIGTPVLMMAVDSETR